MRLHEVYTSKNNDDNTVEQVLAQHREELMRRYNAIGIGFGIRNGKPAIILMVKKKPSENVHLEIEGYPLFIDEIDDAKAY